MHTCLHPPDPSMCVDVNFNEMHKTNGYLCGLIPYRAISILTWTGSTFVDILFTFHTSPAGCAVTDVATNTIISAQCSVRAGASPLTRNHVCIII